MGLPRTPQQPPRDSPAALTSEEGKRPREGGNTDTTTATNHSDKMPDPEVGTPNPAKTVKFANPGQVGIRGGHGLNCEKEGQDFLGQSFFSGPEKKSVRRSI